MTLAVKVVRSELANRSAINNNQYLITPIQEVNSFFLFFSEPLKCATDAAAGGNNTHTSLYRSSDNMDIPCSDFVSYKT